MDLAEEMVEIVQKKTHDLNLKNVRFQKMNAEKLSLSDQYFDVALNALGLMYLPDPAYAIQEMYRVLKPGCIGVALVWGARKNCGWAEVFPFVDKRVPTEVCPLFFQSGTGHTLLRFFEAAGFKDIKEYRLTDPMYFDTENDASDAMFVGGPVALAWKYFDDATRKSARKEYLSVQ